MFKYCDAIFKHYCQKSINEFCNQSKQEQYRHELKYEIDRYQYEILKSRLRNLMLSDSHTDNCGKYVIRSLYFDDWENSCYYENENGTDPREKFRIRIYNGSTDFISLECKRKEAGKTLKKSTLLSVDQVNELLVLGRLHWNDQMNPLLKKLYILQEEKGMRPKVIVEYNRFPFIAKEGNVRITLDMDIRATTEIKKFLEPAINCRPIMPLNKSLLEVKYDNFLPDYIYHSVGLDGLRQIAFSKYYLCRKFSSSI